MKVQDFLKQMNVLAPFESALEWDNVGLLVGNEESEVRRVYVALDLNEDVIRKAAIKKCDLILTHHPMIFKPIKKICASEVVGRRIIELIACEINYVAMHTNFDVHLMGRIVSERIGFNTFEVLDITEEGKNPMGIGTICNLSEPIELSLLASHVRNSFPLPFVTYFGDENKMIKRAAIVPGSGKSEIETAIKAGADVLITGDISHHEGIDAVASGLSIIDAGHYGVEYLFVEYMSKYVKNNMPGIEDVFSESISFPRSLA